MALPLIGAIAAPAVKGIVGKVASALLPQIIQGAAKSIPLPIPGLK